MKRQGWSGVAVAVAAALLWGAMPAAPARAEAGADSTGAAVAAGLMIAVVVVYGLVSLRSDVERYTQADTEAAIVRAAKIADESPIVLRVLAAPIGLGSSGAGAPAEVAGAAVGWRMTF